MKFKKSIPYQILIDPTPNNGFIVTCGCVKVAYSNFSSLLADLASYFANPEEIEKQYNVDIAALGRVHIGRMPDIQVTPYGAGKTASEISMLARNMVEKQNEAEKGAFPMKTPNKEE